MLFSCDAEEKLLRYLGCEDKTEYTTGVVFVLTDEGKYKNPPSDASHNKHHHSIFNSTIVHQLSVCCMMPARLSLSLALALSMSRVATSSRLW